MESTKPTPIKIVHRVPGLQVLFDSVPASLIDKNRSDKTLLANSLIKSMHGAGLHVRERQQNPKRNLTVTAAANSSNGMLTRLRDDLHHTSRGHQTQSIFPENVPASPSITQLRRVWWVTIGDFSGGRGSVATHGLFQERMVLSCPCALFLSPSRKSQKDRSCHCWSRAFNDTIQYSPNLLKVWVFADHLLLDRVLFRHHSDEELHC